MLIITWVGVRIIGKKSIAQMTGYELAGILLLTTAAAEPLVYKIASNAAIGVLTISFATVFIGWLSLHNRMYNLDSKPSIVISKGQILKTELAKNKINVSFLMSMLRLQGYASYTEVEYAIIEPNGNLSVVAKSQERPIKPKDMQIQTPYEGLPLPLIIDGEILKENLSFGMLDEIWLKGELNKNGIIDMKEILLASLDSSGTLNICRDIENNPPPVI
jgi:uncharacterized membrane protein YcaP (DUF421 family)